KQGRGNATCDPNDHAPDLRRSRNLWQSRSTRSQQAKPQMTRPQEMRPDAGRLLLRTGGRGLERTISVMSWDNQPALRRLGSALSGDAPSGLPSVELTLLVQLSTSWKLNSRLTSST
ncbi:hypothetical protein GE061_002663, partial [Apolygus lucorum]